MEIGSSLSSSRLPSHFLRFHSLRKVWEPIQEQPILNTVYAIADKAAGEWAFTTLELRLDKNGERIDLLSKE